MKKYLFVFVSLISSFSVMADGIDLNCSVDSIQCLDCGKNDTIFPLTAFSRELDSLDIEADESEVIDNDTYHFIGEVKLKSNTHVLSADDVKVSTINDSTVASGNVQFQDNAFLISSDKLQVKKEIDGISANANNAYYQDISIDSSGANGFGSEITKTQNNVLIKNASYSLCPISNNDWAVEAKSINLDLKNNRGKAKHAKIEFYGIPILYLPRYSWVLKGRGSGFLTPSYQTFNDSTTKKGAYNLKVPYYFNIAPDRDLLIAATFMKYRGFNYEGKYRQLLGRRLNDDGDYEDSTLQIETKYMLSDWLTKNDRWMLKSSLEYDLNDRVHLSSDYNRVSDKKYIKEISRGDTSQLRSQIKLSYYDKKNLLGSHILREGVQILDGCEETCKDNYLRALEASISKTFKWDKEKQSVSVALISAKFTNPTPGKASGTRTYTNIGYAKDHLFLAADDIYPAIPLISSKVNFNSTYYSLNTGKKITRNIGGAGLDLAAPFKSRISLFNTELSHILIPKLSYKYRGTKAQGDIPIFDTTDNYDDIISFSYLTDDERYTGLDRISNANDFTYSIESGTRDVNSVEKDDPDLLNIKIAQTYYTDDEVVSDTLNQDYEVRRKYSNIAASIGIALGNFTFSNSLSIEPDHYKIVGRANTLGYRVSPRKFATLIYSNGAIERRVKMYASIPLTDSIHVFGGRDKITSTNTTKTETSGFVYESCCWAFRVAHLKKVADSDYDYSTVAELILKGLGSTASSLNDKIETNIPGYISNLD
jgi:LPS-assembly protein